MAVLDTFSGRLPLNSGVRPMQTSHIANAINEALLIEIARLKSCPVDGLPEAGAPGTSVPLIINGTEFALSTWAEPVAHEAEGMFVVLVDSWEPRLLSSIRHMQGFVVGEDNVYRDMTREELWSYD